MTPKELALEEFLRNAQTRTGWPRDKILEKLRETFGGYKKSQEGAMLNWLAGEKTKEIEREEMDARVEALRKANGQPEFDHCPYHPDTLIKGDIAWHGRYTHIPGWRCGKGGLRCYLRWRIDRSLMEKGEPPRDWAKWDAEHPDPEKQ